MVLAALLVLAALALYLLAWQRVGAGIDAQARAKAELLRRGHTPWDFHPRVADDLIAGRVFGDAEAHAGPNALVVRAGGDTAYTLGVPLPYPVALAAWPVASLSIEVQAPTTLHWLVRTRLDGPLLQSAAIALAPGQSGLRSNLQTLHWFAVPSGEPVTAPTRAALLRLKLQHPQGSTIRWQALAWERGARNAALQARPTVLQRAGIGTMLAERGALRAAAPARVIVASADALQARGDQPATWLGWLASLAYAAAWLATCWLTRRRAARKCGPQTALLSLLQVAVCLLPLLVASVGLLGDPDPGPLLLACTAAGVALALWLAWRSYGVAWQWLGWRGRQRWRDWAMPALTTVLVLAMLAWYRPELHWPGARRVAQYAAWAGIQQVLMLAVVAPRLHGLIGDRGLAALGVAILFALAHAPNGLLMELTLLGEFLWAMYYLKRPVLLPVIVAHGCAGILLAVGMAGLPLRSLEVGARFLQ